MELFKIFGTLGLRGVDETNQALDETAENGEKTSSKLGAAFSKIGSAALKVGKVVATGLAAGAAAMTGLTVKALNLSGELEQNMGGSEAVFKQYAEGMQETARNAFSNMGLSTSDFLATANKMGALFQGAGFDIKDSADMSAAAMQRAADVASIMGIDLDSAMESIAGAAKGNFTMMDNLGVAMNDTTIQAYALSKGIDKSTANMTTQEKVGLAMEMFLEKTSYAAGNYAKENETLAGSLSTAKAALTNFLDGSGDVDGLVNSFTNAANVIVKNINEILPRLVGGLKEIGKKIIPLIPGLFKDLLPAVIDGAISLVNSIVEILPDAIDLIVGALPMFIDGMMKITEGIISALPRIIESLVSALPKLIPQIVTGLISLIVTLLTYLPQIIQPIIDYLPEIIVSIVEALISNLPILIEGIVMLVGELIVQLPSILYAIVETVLLLLKDGWNVIWEWLSGVRAPIGEWINENVIQPIVQFFTTLANWFNENVIQPIVGLFSDMWDSVTEFASSAWGKIKNVFSGLADWFKGIFKDAYNKIKGVFEPIVNFFSDIWGKIKDKFSALGTKIGDAIGGAVKSGINGIISMIEGVINKAIGLINGAINLVNKIPGVSVGKISELKMPRLAKGGIVDKSTIANIGEDGAEAVVPLEKNTEWIDKLGERLNSVGSSDVITNKLDELIESIKSLKVYLYGDTLVGELAPAMDSALGDINRLRGRGL